MAHFVSLQRNPPSPEDDIKVLNADSAGKAQAGLWGFMNGNVACEVKVIAGPGSATPGIKYGLTTQVWSFSGLTNASQIRGFSGTTPFTGVLEVHLGAAGATLADQNAALLAGSDPTERARLGGGFVKPVPLTSKIGEYAHAPKIGTLRGLAVHITTGLGAADGFRGIFENGSGSTHFVIDRSGDIAQYVAASIRAHAQGPGNGHFLSVEMVGLAKNDGSCQLMNQPQLDRLRELWTWVRSLNGAIPPKLAYAFAGTKGVGPALDKAFESMAYAVSGTTVGSGVSSSTANCVDSYGLSCHYWLDNAVKPCPGIGIMGQLPQVLGHPARVEVPGDKKWIIPA